MCGTAARYRLKPGVGQRLLEFEAGMRETNMPGFVAEFTLRTDEDPLLCYEIVFFESKEAHPAVTDSPGQDARYRRLLELLEAPPERHDGEILHANPNPSS